MTLRDKIMDKYWSEFIVSEEFRECARRLEYCTPLEPQFWNWFKEEYLENMAPKSLEGYL